MPAKAWSMPARWGKKRGEWERDAKKQASISSKKGHRVKKKRDSRGGAPRPAQRTTTKDAAAGESLFSVSARYVFIIRPTLRRSPLEGTATTLSVVEETGSATE